ncbi:MAG: LuxR C-terminal-related transcriptional regulator [Bacteroidia bacterium]|jgi:DNA-binding CsgD family transcriptional regulator|nr:LuxR C-terminal-related transcriptional regulator [Bacteroidia bacterium]
MIALTHRFALMSFSGKKQQPPVPPLSVRQRDVIKLVATGKSDQEIADILNVSIYTVKTHLKIVYKKWDVRNRLEATNIFKQNQ